VRVSAVEMCVVETCPRTATSGKWCVIHFIRFSRSGNPLRNKATGKRSVQARFEEQHVEDPETGCWLWLGNMDAYGHGRLRVMGADGKPRRAQAHRVSWQMFNGMIPPGLFVIQIVCTDAACVNPDHLCLATRSTVTLLANARRRASRRQFEPTR
jgi:hypothetical protein